jgi:hypothetical protein
VQLSNQIGSYLVNLFHAFSYQSEESAPQGLVLNDIFARSDRQDGWCSILAVKRLIDINEHFFKIPEGVGPW